MPEFVEGEVARLGQADISQQFIAVAFACEQGIDQPIAVAELVRDQHRSTVGEIALVVTDAYQGEGIGSALWTYLIAVARHYGITTVQAIALAENMAVRRLIAKSGAANTSETRFGVTNIQIDLAAESFQSINRNVALGSRLVPSICG